MSWDNPMRIPISDDNARFRADTAQFVAHALDLVNKLVIVADENNALYREFDGVSLKDRIDDFMVEIAR